MEMGAFGILREAEEGEGVEVVVVSFRGRAKWADGGRGGSWAVSGLAMAAGGGGVSNGVGWWCVRFGTSWRLDPFFGARCVAGGRGSQCSALPFLARFCRFWPVSAVSAVAGLASCDIIWAMWNGNGKQLH